MKSIMCACALALPLVMGGCVMVSVDKKLVENDLPDCAGPMPVASGQITSAPVASRALDNAPGKTLTSVKLTVPPGAKANPHSHAGTVFVYVLEGAVCSQVTGDMALKPYKAGDSFFEPPGSQHLGFTNPGVITASVLVTWVADTGAPLTTPTR
ncbi:MAG TPA: cupin domain-containing protein [Hyphomonadaceae bacterium]|nr:cupin domain-containing protein [Hyphomonadaceae bacterium]